VHLNIGRKLGALARNGLDLKSEFEGEVVCCFALTDSGLAPTESSYIAADLAKRSAHILFLLPTVVERCEAGEQVRAIEELIAQVKCVEQSSGILISLQSSASTTDVQARLREWLALGDFASPVPLFIACSNIKSKVNAINFSLDLCARAGIEALSYIDDDVVLGQDAIRHLCDSYDASPKPCAVGARKIPHPKAYRSSRFLNFCKNIMSTPSTQYPHGCCIIISADRFKKGIPARYVCDDGFICFELIDPSAADPQAQLIICDQAICHHSVGGKFWETTKRIRRSLLSVVVFCMDYPAATAMYYLRRIHFAGLWPFSPLDRSKGKTVAAKKWSLKLVLFLWTAKIFAELVVRGLVGKRLTYIDWAAYRWQKRGSFGDGA
jgi:hypothetical protein